MISVLRILILPLSDNSVPSRNGTKNNSRSEYW